MTVVFAKFSTFFSQITFQISVTRIFLLSLHDLQDLLLLSSGHIYFSLIGDEALL
jgi:hypothetical protein